MAVIDPRLVAATRAQLARRRSTLGEGARPLGWKLGMGERERIGGHIALGYLTTATLLAPGRAYAAPPGARLHADAEACVRLGDAEEIVSYGLALEIVDLAPIPGEPESVVAENVFHRAVCLGPFWPDDAAGTAVTLRVGGVERARGDWPRDLPERIAQAAEVLDAVGERFSEDDLVITGSIVQIPIAAGDRVSATAGACAAVAVDIV